MTSKYAHLKFKTLPQDYQYVLLDISCDKNQVINELSSTKLPTAFFLSSDECSLIAPTQLDLKVPHLKAETGWTCFHIVGDMPFGTVQGLIAKVSSKLIEAHIGVCVISTFKSDWFFIRTKYKEQAITILNEDGWQVE